RSEYELLRAFLAAPGRALSRDHLLEAVAGRGSEPFDRSVDVLVGRLRRKVEPEPSKPRLVVTVPGVGYRFAARPRPASAESATPAMAEPTPSPAPPASPERRQLTILHCGLCGPALLAAWRDPEDLQHLLAVFHEHAKSAVTEAGGTVDRLLSDGLVACFGHPQADEHQAERALRAALKLVEATGRIDTGSSGALRVRIGVASGLAVVGGQHGAPGQPTALGEAASAAAGLATAAEPDSVLISVGTRRLVGELFELRPCGAVGMDDAGEPAEAWRVVAEAATESRFEALRGAALAPLVGREEELELLLRRWKQAKAGGGRVVLVSGEPGIGKSRLARAFQDAIAGQPHVALRLFCSPHHQDSALHPSIAQLERAAGFAREDTDEARLAKLDAVLAQSDATDEAVALVAELLSIETDQRERIQQMSPQVRRERTLGALLAQLTGLAARQPVLVVCEDLHWIDPSSRELLDRAIEQVGRLPALLLATFRPEFQPPWAGQPNVTSLALGRLDPRDSAALVAEVAGADELSPEVVREIAERADGVPLFIEEVTRAVLESGAQAAESLSATPHPALSVPATLHASLMARLDRLGPVAKEVAQRGAAVGREFGHELLAAIAERAEPEVREALDRLTGAGLLFARGAPPQSTYLFKHALVRDAAYGTLVRAARQRVH
ncbi:MAG: AAA family ATPase, partial [Chloroflexi bacterium]|nr:AAA family ATPase [Chloroflexota bacterium]